MELGQRYKRLEEPELERHHNSVSSPTLTQPEITMESLKTDPLNGEGLPSLRREKKLKRIEVQTAAYEEMSQVLAGLREDFRQVSAYLKPLCDHLGSKPAAELIRMDGMVEVEIHVAFLRIVDINTKFGYFHAELFVQAKWKEPRLKGMSQVELDHLDHSVLWHPSIVLINAYGEPDDVKIWHAVTASSIQEEEPTVYVRMRVRGQFKETLELQDFPVDIQGLTIIVSCERPCTEVLLTPDKEVLPTVTLETFNDVNEFSLYEHVQIRELEVDPHSVDKYSRSSRIAFTCSVGRKPIYYFVNSLLLQFLIAAIVLLVYVEDPEKFAIRTTFTSTLLLTSVALKFTTASDLPNVSYLTRLEIYGISCKIFLVLQMIENGVVFNLDKSFPDDSNVAVVTDRWCAVAFAFIFIIFNGIYIVIVAKKYRDNVHILLRKENKYKTERKKREVNKYTTSSAAFGKKYMTESSA